MINIGSWNLDYLRIYLDQNLYSTFSYLPDGSWTICEFKDNLVLFNKNLTTHAKNTFTISLNADLESDSYKGILMRNFFLYVDTCDISCATCDGPTNVRKKYY